MNIIMVIMIRKRKRWKEIDHRKGEERKREMRWRERRGRERRGRERRGEGERAERGEKKRDMQCETTERKMKKSEWGIREILETKGKKE